jgi:hypothetical protein
MGLTVELRDEQGDLQGQSVEDPTNVLHRLLRERDLAAYPMLSGIDWYGDTIFNGQQMERFLPEWRTLSDAAKSAEEQGIAAAVLELAQRCQEGVHLFLKFVGE